MTSNIAQSAQVLRHAADRIACGEWYAQRYPGTPRPAGVIETIAVVASGDRYWRNLAGCRDLYAADVAFAEMVNLFCGYLAASGRLTLQPGEAFNQVASWLSDPTVSTAEAVEAMRAAAAFHSSLVGGDR